MQDAKDVLNQDGSDKRMGQDRGMNQDGKDERIDQDLKITLALITIFGRISEEAYRIRPLLMSCHR